MHEIQIYRLTLEKTKIYQKDEKIFVLSFLFGSFFSFVLIFLFLHDKLKLKQKLKFMLNWTKIISHFNALYSYVAILVFIYIYKNTIEFKLNMICVYSISECKFGCVIFRFYYYYNCIQLKLLKKKKTKICSWKFCLQFLFF